MSLRVRGGWATHSGFYLAAIGSAFGLGNIWRFPYVVGTHGGGAFVLMYIVSVFLIGLPLLVAELTLGKVTRKSAVSAVTAVAPGWAWTGKLAVVVSLLLLAYYAVISGWVLYFFMQFLLVPLRGDEFVTATLFDRLKENGTIQLCLTSVHLVLAVFIVGKGIRDGIEKYVKVIMPIFLLLMIFLIGEALSQAGADKALRFMFYPDFSKVTWSTFSDVLGHIFFTLSIGMGAMVAFGSYLKKETHAPTAGFVVTSLDLIISLCVGLLIFPIVFSAAVETGTGQSLLFETIPLLFSRIEFLGDQSGSVFAILFFLCLYTTALVASLGILEASVSNLMDRYKISRGRAAPMMGVVAFVLAILPSLSSSVFADFKVGGMSLLEGFDHILISWILPISAVGIALTVGFKLSDQKRREEFVDEDRPDTVQLYPAWVFVLKWVIPTAIIAALAGKLIDLF